MWTALACVAALSLPAQADELKTINVRTTYGVRGAPRSNEKFLPGDSFVLSYELEGVSVDKASGKVLYSMAIEVRNSKKVIFSKDPKNLEAVIALGGKTLPAFSRIDIGLDQDPGEYTVNIKITDRAAMKSTTLTKKYEVLPKEFGIVRLVTSSDDQALASTTLFGAGESMYVHFRLVGFARDRVSTQPKVSFELRVLDEKGMQTNPAKPFSGEITKDVPPTANDLPVQFLVPLNRAGKYTIEVKATDNVSGKSATMSIPLTVRPE